MNFYDDLVMQTQMNYSKYYPTYASGSTPYQLTDKKPLPYSEQIDRLVQEVKEADCVVEGGASGLSAAGGGDFYYEDNDSYRKYFRPFAEKYHFKGAFAGMMHPLEDKGRVLGVSRHIPSHHPDRTCASFLSGSRRFAERQGLLHPHHEPGYPVCQTLPGGEGGRDSGGSPLLPVRRLLYR